MQLKSLLTAFGSLWLDLNNPPTSVGGIQELDLCFGCRPDLNNPPTSVGGICRKTRGSFSRKDLNDPLTAVSGISTFVQSFLCSSTEFPARFFLLAVQTICAHHRPHYRAKTWITRFNNWHTN